MNRVFVTYGTEDFKSEVGRICKQAAEINYFSEIKAYDPSSLSEEVKSSELFSVKRGGGLWVWKPDIINQTMDALNDGDILVYCDAGCTLSHSKEWVNMTHLLGKYDIIAQKIYKPVYKWTRKEIIDYYTKSNGKGWEYNYQFCATIIIIISDFTRKFIKEWRQTMLDHPEFVYDVPLDDICLQQKGFVENRHDQSVYSALLYKYLNTEEGYKIYSMWERIEDKDIIHPQAIRATRVKAHTITNKSEFKSIIKRLIKDYIYKPFCVIPQDFLYSIKRKWMK